MDISRKSMSMGILSGLLQYLSKNKAILVKKLGAEKNGKIRFRLFYEKKVLWPLSPRGGRGVRP